jgi:hypothetical protein
LDPVILHLIGLGGANRAFQRQEMLVLNAFCFAEDLPPSVFARSFDTQHRQIEGREPRVLVFGDTREDEVGARTILCHGVEGDCVNVIGAH